MLNRLPRSARVEYCNTKYYEYKQNTKKLWALINQAIKKCKNCSTIIPYITVEGLQMYNSTKIANTFRKFYASIGKELAATILLGKHDINHYLKLIPKTEKSLVL